MELTESELVEDVVKVLDTENGTPAKNLVIFSFKDSAYVPVCSRFGQFFRFDLMFFLVQLPPPPNIVTLLSVEGTALHIDSEEAQTQIRELGTGMVDDFHLSLSVFAIIKLTIRSFY